IPYKIVVIKSPYLNAFTFPNGVIYVHTGILARMENEAQLATLLAHEMSHAAHRHAVREFRSTKNKTAFLASVQFSVGQVPLVGDLAGLLGGIGTKGAVSGYSRGLETEADTAGFNQMVQAGYDPREAPKLFLHLKREIEEEEIKEAYFFGTHPRLKERMENYEDLIRKRSPQKKEGLRNTDVFLEKTRRLLLDNARLDLKGGRFQAARRGTEKYLTLKPKDARPHHLMGEILRQQDDKGDLEKAEVHYREAIALDPSYPDPHKGVGLVLYKLGEKKQAVKSLRSYLALAPSASDRGYIENTINQIE
ncbi:MAG TPA: M48 family metalloprotease, partial [Candidatus Manganitrophaceae bacterium]